MNILGLIDIHPFDGTEAFTCLRIDNNGHVFDLPIDGDQLQIVLNNASNKPSEEPEPVYQNIDVPSPDLQRKPEEYAPSPIRPNVGSSYDEDALFIEGNGANTPIPYDNPADYTMGESLWDDDL